MLLKEIFYKRKNEKAWSLRLLPLLFLSCFVLSVQSFAMTTEKNSFTSTQLSAKTQVSTISVSDLEVKTKEIISEVSEFIWIQKEAKKRGFKIWLAGGSASSLVHYAIDEILLEKGVKGFYPENFEKDSTGERNYTDIYLPAEDVNFVFDGDLKKRNKFISDITNRYPFLRVGKRNIIFSDRNIMFPLLRGTKQKMGTSFLGEARQKTESSFKQKIDSNSVALISLNTKGKSGEMTEDLLEQLKEEENRFLKDILARRVSYYNNEHHKETSRSSAMTTEKNSFTSAQVNALIAKGDAKGLQSLARAAFSQPGWQNHPIVLQTLLTEGYEMELMHIVQNNLSGLHWENHTEFLEVLIAKGEYWTFEWLAQYVLPQPYWKNHPEFIEAIIEVIIKRGNEENLEVVDKILSESDWKKHPRLLELTQGEEVNAENLKKALEAEKEQKNCS